MRYRWKFLFSAIDSNHRVFVLEDTSSLTVLFHSSSIYCISMRDSYFYVIKHEMLIALKNRKANTKNSLEKNSKQNEPRKEMWRNIEFNSENERKRERAWESYRVNFREMKSRQKLSHLTQYVIMKALPAQILSSVFNLLEIFLSLSNSKFLCVSFQFIYEHTPTHPNSPTQKTHTT